MELESLSVIAVDTNETITSSGPMCNQGKHTHIIFTVHLLQNFVFATHFPHISGLAAYHSYLYLKKEVF